MSPSHLTIVILISIAIHNASKITHNPKNKGEEARIKVDVVAIRRLIMKSVIICSIRKVYLIFKIQKLACNCTLYYKRVKTLISKCRDIRRVKPHQRNVSITLLLQSRSGAQ